MYETILVPLDGSTFAEAALPFALTLSEKTGAQLHVVAVLEPVTSFAYDGWEAAAREWTENYLDGVRDRFADAAGGEISTEVVSGHVVERLAAEATSRRADLTVMASHGRGALSRLWLGSVADGFVRRTDRPVLLVRPAEDGHVELAAPSPFDTMLIPLDGSELSECALRHAVELGELFDAAYHLTRVVSYPFAATSPYLPDTAHANEKVVEDAKAGAAEYLEEHAERLRRRGLRVTTSVSVDAQPGHGILKEADAVGAGMIAMATHGRAGLERVLLGSSADKVLRGTRSPLLLHRPGESRP